MRINLYSGPGAGKSTSASMLFAKMKMLNYSIELVSEYVKGWAISKRPVVGFDQIYLMGKQLNYEYRFLSHGIKHIVTDSPVLLSACYTRAYYPELCDVATHMEGIIAEYERQHPSINIFLDRGDKPYHTEGRYQTKEQAKLLDTVVRDSLDRLGIHYEIFSFYDNDLILEYIIKAIDANEKEEEAQRITDGAAWVEGLSDLERTKHNDRVRNAYDPEYVASNPAK